MADDKPLFIPLCAEYFDAFERGEKTEEFRPYGPRWNERTCRVGRAVVLSRGYGKARRLHGRVSAFRVRCVSELSIRDAEAWRSCYGERHGRVACITPEIDRS